MGKMITNYNNFQGNNEQKEAAAKSKHLCIILAIMAVCYYMVPFLLIAFAYPIAALVLNISIPFVYPMIILMCCFVYTRFHGVVWYLPIMLWALFLPSIVIYQYDLSIALFSIVYIVFGYFGVLGGYLLLRHKRDAKAPLGMKLAEKLSNDKKGNRL